MSREQDLLSSLTALIAIIRRQNGFMRHEDQSSLFRAEASAAAYSASQADTRQSAQDPASRAPEPAGEIVGPVLRAALARLHQDAQSRLTESEDRPNLRAAAARIARLVELADGQAADRGERLHAANLGDSGSG